MLVDINWIDFDAAFANAKKNDPTINIYDLRYLIPQKIRKGIYGCSLNADKLINDKIENSYPDFFEEFHLLNNWKHIDEIEIGRRLESYGVVDGVDNLLSLYDFDADPRTLVILMTPIFKEHQPSSGGWRWHKWGPYYGAHEPKYEYLYDEDIEVVYVYHVYQIS